MSNRWKGGSLIGQDTKRKNSDFGALVPFPSVSVNDASFVCSTPSTSSILIRKVICWWRSAMRWSAWFTMKTRQISDVSNTCEAILWKILYPFISLSMQCPNVRTFCNLYWTSEKAVTIEVLGESYWEYLGLTIFLVNSSRDVNNNNFYSKTRWYCPSGPRNFWKKEALF